MCNLQRKHLWLYNIGMKEEVNSFEDIMKIRKNVKFIKFVWKLTNLMDFLIFRIILYERKFSNHALKGGVVILRKHIKFATKLYIAYIAE